MWQCEIKRVHWAPAFDVSVVVTVHVEEEWLPAVGGESRSNSHVAESPAAVVCSHVVRDRDLKSVACACVALTAVADTRLRQPPKNAPQKHVSWCVCFWHESNTFVARRDRDAETRVVYWRQERNGMWMRVAIIAKLFGCEEKILRF